ncbi:VIR protein [Plasmodium vivax]|uniref:VIR protein n=1 Tax=Plasmodium vivax TaxID=5855 RepID=A0A1G4E4W8_PLAVI|nr:VIR protein [Plasmodium vivax]
MSRYLGDTALSILNTKYYYTSLNKEKDDCQDEEFYKAAKKKLEDYNWLQDVSDQILKGLCYVYRKRLKGNFESNICKFLYFWLGNILLDKMSHNVVFFDVILDLFNILKNDEIGKFCELPRYYINKNNFKYIKFFFDYSQDYNNYREQLTGNNPSCNYEYKTYLETYVNFYKSVRDECAKYPNRNSYCNEFYQHFNGKSEYLLSNWKCELQEHGREEQELEDEEEEVAEESKLPTIHGMGVYPVTNQNEDSSEKEQEKNGPGSPGYPSGEGTPFLNDTLYPADDPTPSTIKKSITSAASAAGVLVPLFLVYHFTPAKSWINRLLGRKQMYRNPYANQVFMANFSMPEDFYSERNRYNIMYRPE